MTRRQKLFAALLMLPTATGCRLCAECEPEAYPSYGGAWQRTLREHGRVGSVFDPGGSRASDLHPRTEPESFGAPPQPASPDEPDRTEEQEADENQRRDDRESQDSEDRLEQRRRELERLQLDDLQVSL